MKYKIEEKDKARYIKLVLLNEIINFQHYFPVKLEGEDIFLGQYLQAMKENGILDIKKGNYIPTAKGREELVNLYAKFHEYLKMFDIYCAVDLEKGEFAFSSIDDIKDDNKWFEFLEEERFSDVRVAVAEFKNIDAIEIIFMTFLNENKFDCTAPRWQHNLVTDKIWLEVEEIANTAISSEYLKTDGVLEDVIRKGTKIAMERIKIAEDSLKNENDNDESDEIIEEEIVEIVEMPVCSYGYWDPYYDPYYVSPLWLVPAILLF